MAQMTKEITRDCIEAWNRIIDEAVGTKLYYSTALEEQRLENGRWVYIGFYPIRAIYAKQEGERFYIKQINDNLWLYWENPDGSQRWRWRLNEIAEKFFL